MKRDISLRVGTEQIRHSCTLISVRSSSESGKRVAQERDERRRKVLTLLPVPVSSCSCVMSFIGGPPWWNAKIESNKASINVENQESTVLEQLQDQQADAEMAMKKEADKRQQQRDRMKKRRALMLLAMQVNSDATQL